MLFSCLTSKQEGNQVGQVKLHISHQIFVKYQNYLNKIKK